MAHQQVVASDQATDADPEIRKIGAADLFGSLARGIASFDEKPSHFGFPDDLMHLVAALAPAKLIFGYDLLHLPSSPVAGLTSFGPVIAVGLHEFRRCREQGSGDRLESRFRKPKIHRHTQRGALSVRVPSADHQHHVVSLATQPQYRREQHHVDLDRDRALQPASDVTVWPHRRCLAFGLIHPVVPRQRMRHAIRARSFDIAAVSQGRGMMIRNLIVQITNPSAGKQTHILPHCFRWPCPGLYTGSTPCPPTAQ